VQPTHLVEDPKELFGHPNLSRYKRVMNSYSEVSNLGNTNCHETGMDAGYAVVQIADF